MPLCVFSLFFGGIRWVNLFHLWHLTLAMERASGGDEGNGEFEERAVGSLSCSYKVSDRYFNSGYLVVFSEDVRFFFLSLCLLFAVTILTCSLLKDISNI